MTGKAIGIDLGGTFLRASLFTTSSEPVESVKVPHGIRSAEDFITALKDVLQQLGSVVPGFLGVGIPGMVTPAGLVRKAPHLQWRDVPLAKELAHAFPGASTAIINDVSAIAAGEAAFGGMQGADEYLAVWVGTGIGAAYATSGQRIEAASGLTGELGHTKVPGSAAACECGGVGCLEAHLGGPYLLRECKRQGLDIDSLIQLSDLAAKGDAIARGITAAAGNLLSQAVANAVTLTGVTSIALGGGVMECLPALRRRVTETCADYVVAPFDAELRFFEPVLGWHAGTLGAAMASGWQPASS